MKLLDTLHPIGVRRPHAIAYAILLVALLSTFPAYSQCDINIFQRGTISTGSVSLMPWLSYTSGCEINNDCGDLSALVVWDMEDIDPCDNKIPKPNISNSLIDLSTSTGTTECMFVAGNKSAQALAIIKGNSSRFKVEFSPTQGQSGQISHLIYSVRSIIAKSELLCEEDFGIKEPRDVDYSIAVLSRGKQMYMGLKSVSSDWEQEIIDLDFISDGENLYSDSEQLDLEIIITNFTTTGDSMLGLDDLIFEGKECVFDDNLAYQWSTGETTERIYSTKKGNYCVTVTDCNGCQAVDCINVD